MGEYGTRLKAPVLALGRMRALAFAVSGSLCLVARGKVVAVCRSSSSSEVIRRGRVTSELRATQKIPTRLGTSLKSSVRKSLPGRFTSSQ